VSTPLLALRTGDSPAAWAALGFLVEPGGRCRVGAVTLVLDGGGGGIRGWTLGGEEGPESVDGVPTSWASVPAAGEAGAGTGAGHPNGTTALDHVVFFTGSRDRTVDALVAAGGDLRRSVDSPPMPAPMAFVRFGPAIVEVAQADRPPGLWGLVAVVPDVDALAASYGSLVGAPRDAVQPGRRIVTAAAVPGLEVALAFITPRG
jgi:hypothetical protein